ncbi:hypothetical protein [Psychroserpens sp. SPM9]|uniref:hypothetical protein n=1 Tax=Psychroserpens sp. SPM9 TaxID=2975598 RepID=UPI0021A4F99F|nr:hypothetical protein [Psychroserpens sp. SPM9]MDG5490139.1 hypothetical protein [Psychroserpens sp. SPM9]
MSKKKKVIFYYPQHFNRSDKGTNPFFEPLIKICQNNNIDYLLLEEPDDKTSFPKNPEASRFNIFRVIVLRKLLPLLFFKNFESREQFIGVLVRLLTFKKYKANTIITISNPLGGFWRGYNSHSRIIDYQHGIINKTQPGFFENGKAPLHISYNEKEVAVWGEGFLNVFNQDGSYYKNKVHALGYFKAPSVSSSKAEMHNRNAIIFTLQFLPDQGDQRNHEMFEELKLALEQFKNLDSEEQPKIILKHHPRHNNCIDLNPLSVRFDYVSVLADGESFKSENCLINVTFYSTTAFDLAADGIPSYFLYTESVPNGKTDFLEDYKYPILQEHSLIELWQTYKNNRQTWLEHSHLVRLWSSRFFQPLNQECFLDLVSATKDV